MAMASGAFYGGCCWHACDVWSLYEITWTMGCLCFVREPSACIDVAAVPRCRVLRQHVHASGDREIEAAGEAQNHEEYVYPANRNK